MPSSWLAAIVLMAVMVAASCARKEQVPRFSRQLSSAMAAGGLKAATELYNQRRSEGFQGDGESEVDTNAFGYSLLRRGDTAAAIRFLELNAQTHPQSTNAFDSLGEACLAAGNSRCAVSAYERVLVLRPDHRGARYELHRLTGRPLPPFPMVVMLHILGGIVGIGAAALAMVAPKGRQVHVASGRVFVVAMALMAASAMIRAGMNYSTQGLNFWMGSFTLYLVITGWRAGRRRIGPYTPMDRALAVMALVVSTGLYRLGLLGGAMAGPAFVFGTIALVSAVADLRSQSGEYPRGRRREARHWWRMILASFIAIGSLFLGQSQVFPYAVRQSGVLFVPPLLVLLALAFWGGKYQVERLRAWRSRRTLAVTDVGPECGDGRPDRSRGWIMWRAVKGLLIAFGILAALLAVGAAILLREQLPARPELSGRVVSESLTSGGRVRTWLTYVPQHLGEHPGMILVLHGSMGSSEQARADHFGYDFDRIADRERLLVVYPQGFGGNWNNASRTGDYSARRLGVDDVGFLEALVTTLVARRQVDSSRVFVAGVSNGGSMVERLALELPKLARGYAVVSASLPTSDNLAGVPSGEPVSILFMNGTMDPIVPWSGGEVKLWPVLSSRGYVRSVDASVAYFRDLAGATSAPAVVSFPDLDRSDGSTVKQTSWQGSHQERIVQITIVGGGHGAPHPEKRGLRLLGHSNRDIHAADAIWTFFDSLPAGQP